MTPDQLVTEIRKKKSFLCVGLDTDIQKIPAHLLSTADPVFEFNKAIIEATSEFAVAYKPNLAFYEAMGPAGWNSLKKTLEVIPPGILKIADAKRGDIGNTATLYAKAFFETWGFDAITVAPYMGEDSIQPFLEFENKWVFVLGLTSNPGSKDFQFHTSEDPLYKKVLRNCIQWEKNAKGNLGFVIGATQSELMKGIREIAPANFLLVPGIGAQGGDLKGICEEGMNENVGLLVNASRSIQYAGNNEEFQEAARKEAAKIATQMAVFLS